MENWQLISLETDLSGEILGSYFEQVYPGKLMRLEFDRDKIHNNKMAIECVLEGMLKDIPERKLAIYGSGYWHHYTYGLCKQADKRSSRYAYFHFDHHDDFCTTRSNNPDLHCGSFVDQIIAETNASTAFFVGSKVYSFFRGKLLPTYLPNISEAELRSPGYLFQKNGMELLEKKISDLPNDVYLSFDLDVMAPDEIFTDFDQGTMKLPELLEAIEVIKKNKHIIGADILGYAGSDESSKAFRVYEKIIESLLRA